METDFSSRKERLRTHLKELIDDMTIHGPAKILKSQLVLTKLIWTFFFTFSAGYCGYVVV